MILQLGILLLVVASCIFSHVARAADANDEVVVPPLVSTPVLVQTKLGKVQGVREMGIDFFGGIPYAAPPVGSLRWAPPEEPSPWKPHLLDATRFGPDCWQIVDPLMNPGADVEHMSEDCLYLNIYVPAGHVSRRSSSSSSSSSLLPVMVWLHGGAFQQGGARRPEYDGRRLVGAHRDVVVVTLNYRLGALGFLVSSEDGLFGNFGLQDQRAALHFLQENIASFGGDPNAITLFGESAGAVMIGLHLLMDNRLPPSSSSSKHKNGQRSRYLFRRAILQSNPMGYQFRSVVVADFIGSALKRSLDCRDLDCLRTESVEDIMKSQSSLMGIPRSVGDFFTWGPTLTQELQITVGGTASWNGKLLGASSDSSSLPNLEHRSLFRIDQYMQKNRHLSHYKFSVNVSQPLLNLDQVPDEVSVIIGTNAHEGEMFVHSAFPISMSKAVYWMFVGALFKDSAARVLNHYRPYVDELEAQARATAEEQILEEENRQYYLENKGELEQEYLMLLEMQKSNGTGPFAPSSLNSNSEATVEDVVNMWNRGGALFPHGMGNATNSLLSAWRQRMLWPFESNMTAEEIQARQEEKLRLRQEKLKERTRAKALKEAAKVVLDYRPVMSRIITDYLFRCPSWHYAHILSRNRVQKGKKNNVYVYRFSQPTHIPGFRECWGKSCHTAEFPYVFQAMEIIRTNYSTLSPIAQDEAPEQPEYPYTAMLGAYRGALENAEDDLEEIPILSQKPSSSNGGSAWNMTQTSRSFHRLLRQLFGDYFMEDADEEIAHDMAERWVAFAKTGDPNYEGSKVKWIPWRFIPNDEKLDQEDFDAYRAWEEGDDELWFDFDEEEDPMSTEGFLWAKDEEGKAYRRRALRVLGMSVVEEDLLRTELVRNKRKSNTGVDEYYFSWSNMRSKGDSRSKVPLSIIRQIQRIAQDMGVLGTGLKGEERRRKSLHSYWDDDFFPQLLELKWPPEERLIERDCSCDFWERIRYRY